MAIANAPWWGFADPWGYGGSPNWGGDTGGGGVNPFMGVGGIWGDRGFGSTPSSAISRDAADNYLGKSWLYGGGLTSFDVANNNAVAQNARDYQQNQLNLALGKMTPEQAADWMRTGNFGSSKIVSDLPTQHTNGFVDYLKSHTLGPDGKMSKGWEGVKDVGRMLWMGLRAVGNPVTFLASLGIGYGLDKLKDTETMKNLMESLHGSTPETRQAATERFLQNLNTSGESDRSDPSRLADRSGSGIPSESIDPSPRGGGAGNYGSTTAGMRGVGGGPGGSAQGGYMGNPNIGMPMSWMMPVAGSNVGIPVIQGPSWVGPAFDPNSYEPIQF